MPAMVNISDAIVRSPHVENGFIAITKGIGSGFIPLLGEQKQLANPDPDNIKKIIPKETPWKDYMAGQEK